MQIITLQAHFDGRQILLDEPYELEPNTKLVVSLIDMKDEADFWQAASSASLDDIWDNAEDDVYAELLEA